jgi:Domain of Unknown Function (DUF1543)
MHLFMIYIGGTHQHSLIELHDIRFVVADSIESTYDQLRKSWWGITDSLHLDCWGVVKHVDGYDIHLRKYPANHSEKLFFVNVGGYDATQFTELHQNFCLVAVDDVEAKQQAKQQISHWQSPHRDYLHEIDQVFNVQDALAEKSLYIHLEPTLNATPFVFTCQYLPIGQK